MRDTINDFSFGYNIALCALTLKKDPIARQMTAERLHNKYTKMLQEGDMVYFCEGAIQLLEDFDKFRYSDVLPEPIDVDLCEL